jgi:hypothetical protein
MKSLRDVSMGRVLGGGVRVWRKRASGLQTRCSRNQVIDPKQWLCLVTDLGKPSEEPNRDLITVSENGHNGKSCLHQPEDGTCIRNASMAQTRWFLRSL